MAKKELIALLERGYFPEELPPPFTTKHFSQFVDSSLTNYRQSIDLKLGNKWTDFARHNYAQNGRIRRVFGIVHPKHFFRLADLIQKNWTDIDIAIRRSSLTKTAPVWGSKGQRALVRQSNFDDRVKFRADISHGARFLLQTDVERFFPSIYTHSIPWAIHGKSVAKKALAKGKKSGLFGDELDRAARSAQSGQTIGIPIGPDTSRVLSELVLAAVDESLPVGMKRDAFRFVDDYEFAFATAEGADDCFTALHESLSEFELAPNLRKTHTHRLPENLESMWAVTLRNHRFGSSRTALQERYALEEFFQLVTRLSRENPTASVIKFGVGKLLQIPGLHKTNWRYVLGTVANLAVNDPSCIENCLTFYKRFHDNGFPAYKPILRKALNAVIGREAPLRHSNYIAWALWACLVLEVKVNVRNVKLLQEIDDVVVALLTLHAGKNGLLNGTPSFANWKTAVSGSELYGRMWLLSYEARYKGWLPSYGVKDHLAGDILFRKLRANRVYFYEEDAVVAWQGQEVSRALEKAAISEVYSE